LVKDLTLFKLQLSLL